MCAGENPDAGFPDWLVLGGEEREGRQGRSRCGAATCLLVGIVDDDLALDDLQQGDVCGSHAWGDADEGGTA